MDSFFDDKSSGFLRYFGMTKTTFLDDFNEDLSTFKPSKDFVKKIKELNFSQTSRILFRDIQFFTKKFETRKIPECSSSRKHTYNPFEILYMKDKNFVNSHIEEELGELISFGHDINVSAHKIEEYRKNKKKQEEFRVGLTNFKNELQRLQSSIFNSYLGLTERFKRNVKISKEALFLMTVSICVFLIGYFIQKRFVRIQVLLWMLSAGLLMFWGLKMHNGAVRTVKGCLTAYEFMDHGLYLDDHFYDRKKASQVGGNNIYNFAKACLVKNAGGNIEQLMSRKRRQKFEWGFKILKGFSHDLTFLETDDTELKSIRKFEKTLQMFKNYDTSNPKLKKVGKLTDPSMKLKMLNASIACTDNQFVPDTSECKDSKNIYQPGDSITHRNEQSYCLRVQDIEWDFTKIMER